MLMQSDPQRYVAQLEEILNNFPSDVMAAYNIGVALVHLGKPQEAIEAFDRVLWTDPRHTHALGQKALLLYNMGDAITAYHLLKAALEDDPNLQPYCQALPIVEAASAELKKQVDVRSFGQLCSTPHRVNCAQTKQKLPTDTDRTLWYPNTTDNNFYYYY